MGRRSRRCFATVEDFDNLFATNQSLRAECFGSRSKRRRSSSMNEQAVLYTHTKAFYRALKAQDFDSLRKLCANVFSRCSMKMRTLVDSRQLALRGTVDSQLADHLHEVVDFSVHGRLADVQVLLHRDAGKEGQDHLGEHSRFHGGFLGFDISPDQIFEKGAALGNDFLRRGWEHRKLVHGIDREATLLTLQVAGPEFQKALDVIPAERLGGQQFFLLPFSQVVPQTLQIQVSLVRELGIEAGLVYTRSLFQVLKAGIREAVFPEDRQRLLQNAFPAEVLRSPHGLYYDVLNWVVHNVTQHWNRADAFGPCLTERRQSMILTGNTIFITGGGSGIGRGLAEALHKRGNLVIISGRRKSHLEATTKANPGMVSVELDLQDPKSIATVAKKLIAQYPKLNVLINNAGIMQIDDAAGVIDDALLVSTVNTNLLGTIRVTSALIEHLKKQPSATIIYNTSVLGYVPLAITAVYSSTKAALHSYVLSQRYKLKSTTVRVLEIAPPWVQTDLMGSNNEPRAMSLADFIKETIDVLGTDAQEVLVERAKPLRNNPGPNEGVLVTQFNDSMSQTQPRTKTAG